MTTALECLVSDPALFLEESFGKHPRLSKVSCDLSSWATIETFDQLLTESLLPSVAFRLVKDGTSVPAEKYTRPFRGRRDESTAVADAALVYDWFSSGATIIFEALHSYSPPLRDLCWSLEKDLGRPTQINAYLTPPRARGFKTHVDSHDVFVVQLFGNKNWLVYRETDPEGREEPLLEHDLQVGEVLYIPAGFAHSALTQMSASAHLTIGILETKWADLFDDLVGVLDQGDRAEVHQFLSDDDSGEVAVEPLIERMSQGIERIDREELRRRLARRFFSSRHYSMRGHLRRLLEADHIDDSTLFEVRADWQRFEADHGLVVLLPDRQLNISNRLSPAVNAVLELGRGRVGDLSAYLPEPDRFDLISKLVKEGLLDLQ